MHPFDEVDVYPKTKQRFADIGDAVEPAPSSLHEIVRTGVSLTDVQNRKQAIEACELYCKDARLVDTIRAIDRFVNPKWLVEIEVDAVVVEWSARAWRVARPH